MIQVRQDDLKYVENQIMSNKKYAIIWDKTMHGTLHARYHSKGVCVDLIEEYERVKAGVKKDYELRD